MGAWTNKLWPDSGYTLLEKLQGYANEGMDMVYEQGSRMNPTFLTQVKGKKKALFTKTGKTGKEVWGRKILETHIKSKIKFERYFRIRKSHLNRRNN